MIDIATWKKLQTELKITKANEATARREICEAIGTDVDLSEKGRATVKTHLQGFNLKAVYTLSYSIDKAALASVWDKLSPAERDAIKLVPELKLADYKKLPEDALLHEAVTAKPAMPTLEATEPGE